MSKIKGVNKWVVENNLKVALMNALTSNDVKALHKAAQDVIDAGYELEDLKILPGSFNAICNALLATGFSPKNYEIEGLVGVFVDEPEKNK